MELSPLHDLFETAMITSNMPKLIAAQTSMYTTAVRNSDASPLLMPTTASYISTNLSWLTDE